MSRENVKLVGRVWPGRADMVEFVRAGPTFPPDVLALFEPNAEIEFVTGTREVHRALTVLGDRGVLLPVVTAGAQGAHFLWRGEVHSVPAPKVQVVSPMGAGDAFVGAFAARLSASGWDAERGAEALPAALEAGAKACTTWGAQA